jgi:hypothetical protein
MNFRLEEATTLLARTPALMDLWLRGLPDSWLDATEGPDTWSPRVVIGHLIHGEDTDWIPRARLILEHGEARPFDRYDRFAQFERFRDHTMDQLLDLFAARRRDTLDTLQGWRLTEAQLDLRGQHPGLGPVTLRQLLATWVAHDLDHVVQIARVMGKHYLVDVGPWTEYLRVMSPL